MQRHSVAGSGAGFGDMLASRLYPITVGNDWDGESSPLLNKSGQNFVKVSGQLDFSLLRELGSVLVGLELLELVVKLFDLISLGARGLVKHDCLDCCMHGLLWGRKCVPSVCFIKLWLILGATKLLAMSRGA